MRLKELVSLALKISIFQFPAFLFLMLTKESLFQMKISNSRCFATNDWRTFLFSNLTVLAWIAWKCDSYEELFGPVPSSVVPFKSSLEFK